MATGRAWSECTVLQTSIDSTILEIQVFEECWQHAKSWETTKTRPIAEVLQLGIVTEGSLRWSEPRSMSPRVGSRHLL